MNKKIIVFDLDGTLAVSKTPVTEHMADLLKKLIEQKMVCVISGGHLAQFKTQLLSAFQQDGSFLKHMSNLTLLPACGSERYEYNTENNEWKMTDSTPLSEALKEKIKNVLKEIISSGRYDFAQNPHGEIIEDRGTEISVSGLGQRAPIEEKKLWDPDHAKRQKIKAEIETNIGEVTAIIGGTTTVDILPKGFNKAVALERLLAKLNLRKEDVIFVGDALFPGGNDYSVFEAGIETIQVAGPEETELLIKKWIE